MRDVGGRDREQRAGGQRPSGLRTALDAIRSVPERMKRPESLLMLLALFASIGFHMPPYLGLGALADYFDAQEREKEKAAPPPISFDVVSDATPKEPEQKLADKPEPKKPKAPDKAKQPPKPEPQKPEPPKRVVKVVPEPEPPPAAPPPPDPPKEERKQSITQKSADPNVEPPPDAKYLAEESQRVEEESVSSVTSETKNDPTPQASAPKADGPEKSGDSRADERGAEKGAQDEQKERVASRDRPATQTQPTPPTPSQTPPPSNARPGQVGPAEAPRAEAPAETVVQDPLGSFVLAPSNPNQAASGARQQSGRAGAKQPNLKVSWRAFEQTYGEAQLAQDRMPREARRRGAGREKKWEEFRAAIENYVVGVKPGNTTALNAAADPFAAYLASFHRNLHMEFAHEFLASLPMAGELGNPALVTKVEIVVNPDGSLDRVGVVKSSGNLMYDFGAFNAVQRGGPYPPPPEKIRSPDGRVYMRWALHRNESQCGTWNAEPYILKTAPRSPNDPKLDNVSPYRPGGDTEQGRAPREEPKRAPPGKTPAVAPGETLGVLDPRRVVRDGRPG